MNKTSLFCSLLCIAFISAGDVCAQPLAKEGTKDKTKDYVLHIIKTDINAESENAEVCVEFDKTLAPLSSARLAASLRLESGGKKISLPALASTGSSVCLFPLQRGASYHLDITGLRGSGDEKMDGIYKTSFTIPDRSAMLGFTGKNGSVNGFDFYDRSLTLRAVNISHVTLAVYRLNDIPSLAQAWQNRAQTSLAPTESVYLAKEKGKRVWQGDINFDAAPNVTTEQEITLRDKIPDLDSGVYLIVADAPVPHDTKPASKGLSPLAAAWFTRADFSLQAIHDAKNIHVFCTRSDNAAPKSDLRLIALDAKGEIIGEGKSGADGSGIITLTTSATDAVVVMGIDKNDAVAFADSMTIPMPKISVPIGVIQSIAAVPPLEKIDVFLSQAKDQARIKETSMLRLIQADRNGDESNVPALMQGSTKVALFSPAIEGMWNLRWQKNDGTILGTQNIAVSDHPSLPHLETISHRDSLNNEGSWSVGIKSVAADGKNVPLVGGRAVLVWHKMDAAAMAWKDYVFGADDTMTEAPVQVGNFVTDIQGDAQIHVTLPPHPQQNGLYQAELDIEADDDSGVINAPPLTLPLRPDAPVIGIKALTTQARFPQNGLARFSLIGIGSDSKPYDIKGLSYQLYEAGRSFSWFQEDGRWKYKQAAQLRPIGGGDIDIKENGSSILEWPVTAGNYRLEILDGNGKALAQTSFSAGWDSTGVPSVPPLPLVLKMPQNIQMGHEATVHFMLPEPAMVTAVIADGQIRKTFHEYRAKGDNSLRFIPAPEWQENISISLTAHPTGTQTTRIAVAEAYLSQAKKQGVAPAPSMPVADTKSLSLEYSHDSIIFPLPLHSDKTWDVEGKKNLFVIPSSYGGSEITALISRRPMDGVAEILSYVLRGQAFTTVELSTKLDALRLWRDILDQTGQANTTQIDAERHAMFIQMLRHQNKDGGFAPYRGVDSSLDDTAAALTALGNENSAATDAAKKRAIGFIKQHLANTWVEGKDRGERAAAYAALAAADATDSASLHYFSDTSATETLPAIAEAHIAAAFKQIKDPNAAAFWIRKMLNEHEHTKDVALLDALAATDALASDDVQAAISEMKNTLRKKTGHVSLSNAAMLLRAIDADNQDAGKEHFTNGHDTHAFTGVAVVRGAPSILASYRNSDTASLSVTLLSEDKKQMAVNTEVTRHIYRMNGIEIAHPVPGENYLVELKGVYPTSGVPVVVQDSGLHPLGCPLSPRMDVLSFVPWLDIHGLSENVACEFSHQTMNVILPATDKDDARFTIVYFARNDGVKEGNMPIPQVRGLE